MKHPEPPRIQTLLPLIDPDLNGHLICLFWKARHTVDKSNPLNLILGDDTAKVTGGFQAMNHLKIRNH